MYTARLKLLPFCESDVPELLAMFRDAHVRRYLLDDNRVDEAWVRSEVRASAALFARGGLGLFVARLRKSDALVGFTGLRQYSDPPETQLIYGILPAFVGQGLATEMARAVVDAAILRLGMAELRAAIDAPNVASGRVLERLGFRSAPSGDALLRFVLPAASHRPRIRAASLSDRAAVRRIHEAAFGRRGEADLVEALEDGGHVVASLLATIGDEPVGHVLFTELPLQVAGSDRQVRGVALAPVAILPDVQRRGLGGALIAAGLDACRQAGAQAAVVLGHAAYYPRFGFSAQLARSIRAPWSGPSFMALELTAGALADVEVTAIYAPPFFSLE
jgi:putative acetyltransferase